MSNVPLVIINAFLFIVPAYIGNASAALFGHGKPIDSGRKLADGRRLFGDGKTWAGFLLGVFFAFAAGTTEGYFLQGSGLEVGGVGTYALLGLMLGIGSMTGDLLGSFVKRRMGFGRGKKAPLWDQLNFVLGAILFAAPIMVPPWNQLLVILVATPGIHLFLNWLGHELNCKPVPW
ncbi:CDP-2,3-bis-(O-geranylgeranyl)-sn-glycerol synthase [Candidatus Micrarchaeota archaeon]|nr:CDP-2,3-bis-(O-geranylgeranyl)-sn-glycerol synthase [Candidatus Micrarchaeota archaeon]